MIVSALSFTAGVATGMLFVLLIAVLNKKRNRAVTEEDSFTPDTGPFEPTALRTYVVVSALNDREAARQRLFHRHASGRKRGQ